jgi:hypothetical protein
VDHVSGGWWATAALCAVQVSMVLWVIGFALGIWWSDRANRLTVALWIAGLGFLVLHILLSMGVFHGWSHAQAVQATARRTEEWFGFRFGGGIYANYLFVAVWLLDTLLRTTGYWAAGKNCDPWEDAALKHRLAWAIDGFMIFMIVQATVVFALGPTRWIGLLCGLGLSLLGIYRRMFR